MRGLVVLFLVLFWSSPVLPGVSWAEPMRLAQHAPVEDSVAAGHALDSGPIAEENGEAAVDTGQCSRAEGWFAYYSCRARALSGGLLQAILLPLLALLALLTLSMVLLWFYTRRAANAARLAAEYVPAVERAYVFGGPTDLFLLHDQASVRLAMQNFGKTPAVIRGWLVEFLAQEPRGRKPTYDESKRTDANEILEPDKLFSPAVTFRSEIAAPFFIVGYISYDDVFRKAHTTRFCVAVTRDSKASYAGHAAWNAYD
jgi:hypothetical protein